jgi:hypothetical protein
VVGMGRPREMPMPSLRIRRHRKPLFAALVLSLTSSTLLLTQNVAQADLDNCNTASVKSQLTITGRETDYNYDVTIEGGQVHKTPNYTTRDVSVGKTIITVLSCKRADGTWALYYKNFDPAYNDLKLTVVGGKITDESPVSGPSGYAWMVQSMTASEVTVSSVRCRENPKTISALGVIHGLLELPWPAPKQATIGMYIVDKLLPDTGNDTTYYCGRLDSDATPDWHFGSLGKANWDNPGTGTYQYVESQRDTPCYVTSCVHYWVNEMTITKS